jgi:parallel beta-helix repeat protein
LFECEDVTVRNCTVRHYPGDGISFQVSQRITVEDCASEENAGLGLHPGSGSQHPVVRRNVSRHNGGDGLYVCWRVKYGEFEGNELEGNEGHGISIGHKDSDNVFRENRVIENGRAGILFRNDFVVFDEAHTLEDVAADHLGIQVSQGTVDYLLNKLFSPRQVKGLLALYGDEDSLAQVEITRQAGAAFFAYLAEWLPKQSNGTGRVRDVAVEHHIDGLTGFDLVGDRRRGSGVRALAPCPAAHSARCAGRLCGGMDGVRIRAAALRRHLRRDGRHN